MYNSPYLEHTVEQMYNKYRNFNDNVLYIYFGEV